LHQSVAETHEKWTKRITTGQLNQWLKKTQANPGNGGLPGGARLKFLTQTNTRPPTFVLFYNGEKALPTAFQRKLISNLVEEFEFESVPVRVHMRKSEKQTQRRRPGFEEETRERERSPL